MKSIQFDIENEQAERYKIIKFDFDGVTHKKLWELGLKTVESQSDSKPIKTGPTASRKA